MIQRITARTILTVLLALPALLSAFQGKVVGVSDGDTIKVLRTDQGKPETVKVRLWGVDAPEKAQAYGQAAKKFTSEACFGKVVEIEVRSMDRYGRSVGWVTLEDRSVLNMALLKAGLAWWYRQYAKKAADLQAAEAEARSAHRGLWAEKDSVPPWEWRKYKKGKKK